MSVGRKWANIERLHAARELRELARIVSLKRAVRAIPLFIRAHSRNSRAALLHEQIWLGPKTALSQDN